MAFIRATGTKFLLDEFDMSGATMSYSVELAVAALETTNFASTGAQNIAGLPGGGMNCHGYYNGKGAGFLEYEIYQRMAGAGVAYVGAQMGAAGFPAYVLPTTWGDQLTYSSPVTEILALDGKWPANGKWTRGLVLYDGTISATGAQTGVDFVAPGSTGGVAYLQVRTITGAAVNATIIVQSDSDVAFGTPATEGTFTFSSTGFYVITLSGVIGRYVRISCGTKGGATSFIISAIACVNGVTQ